MITIGQFTRCICRNSINAPRTRAEWRRLEVAKRQAWNKIIRAGLPVYVSRKAASRRDWERRMAFLQTERASGSLAAALAASVRQSDLMDRIGSSRFEGAIAAGKGYGRNAGEHADPYTTGSAELPTAYAPALVAEASSSPDTLDAGTEYAPAIFDTPIPPR